MNDIKLVVRKAHEDSSQYYVFPYYNDEKKIGWSDYIYINIPSRQLGLSPAYSRGNNTTYDWREFPIETEPSLQDKIDYYRIILEAEYLNEFYECW